MHTTRKRLPGELGFAVILLVFALLVLVLAWRISGLAGPSTAGVFPMLAGLAMVGSAIAILLGTRRMRPESDQGVGPLRHFMSRIAPWEILVYALIVIAFMAALVPLGFIISAFLFLLASFLYLHRHGILLALGLSVGAIALILLVFRYVFQVILPEGPWL
jgi:hypothetical protein